MISGSGRVDRVADRSENSIEAADEIIKHFADEITSVINEVDVIPISAIHDVSTKASIENIFPEIADQNVIVGIASGVDIVEAE